MIRPVIRDLEPLYHELSNAFPHPFDWMVGVSVFKQNRPPFWRPQQRKGYDKLRQIFRVHGFTMNASFCQRFGRNPNGYKSYGLDAGGSIICELAYALEPQTGVSWEEYLWPHEMRQEAE